MSIIKTAIAAINFILVVISRASAILHKLLAFPSSSIISLAHEVMQNKNKNR